MKGLKEINRRRWSYLALAIAALIIIGVCLWPGVKPTPNVDKASKDLSNYELSLSLDTATQTLSGRLRLDYVNGAMAQMDTLYFHLYPNAFAKAETAPFPENEWSLAYPKGFSPGGIEISRVIADGQPVVYAVEGEMNTNLKVMLPAILTHGERITLEMDYTVQLPHCEGRFGYGTDTYNLANCYPIACVYDENGWNRDPYTAVGDPFYSDMANYRVIFSAPESMVVAATGDLTKEESRQGITIRTYEAKAVRDYAIVGSEKFQRLERKVGKTTVYAYGFTGENLEKALDAGAASLRIYNRLFATYPYRQLSVVEANFYIGGMEFPNLVMIDTSLYGPGNEDWLEMVVAHEVAHQWWYQLVGNNEVREPWLDEALTQASTVLYFGERYGKAREEAAYDAYLRSSFDRIKLGKNFFPSGSQVVDRPITEFQNSAEYDSIVYGKGGMMIMDLRDLMGDKNFYHFLETYVDQNVFGNATKADFIAAAQEATGKNWDPVIQDWLKNDLE